MADTKISELASATSLADTDVLCGVNSGSTRKFTLARIRDFFAVTFDANYAEKTHTHNSLSNGAYTVSIPSTIKKNEPLVLQSEKTAENISYSNTSSKMDAENVQQAIDELKSEQSAASISYSNTGSGLSGATVQAAIDELDEALDGATQKIETNETSIDTNTKSIKSITDSKGKASGYAGLNANGVVPDSQLPTYVTGVTVSIKNMTVSITATTS